MIAVDGATGEAKWKWQPEAPSGGNRRGVSVGEGLVFSMASGGRAGNDQNNDPNAPPGEDIQIVALDQDTGEEVWITSPLGPDGDTLGRDSGPATRYHDGLVYIHTNNGPRGSVSAFDATDGSLEWTFYGVPERGTVYTDVNGNTVDPTSTWGPVRPDGFDCALDGGATPWMHGALDPELGLYYMTFGNPRSCGSSQDGSGRPGDNLFSSTMVAVDLKTGDVQVALPVHPARRVGHGQRAPADAGRRRGGRRDAQGHLLRQQVGAPVRPRPDERQAGAARRPEADDHRLAAGAAEHTALPGEAPAARVRRVGAAQPGQRAR